MAKTYATGRKKHAKGPKRKTYATGRKKHSNIPTLKTGRARITSAKGRPSKTLYV